MVDWRDKAIIYQQHAYISTVPFFCKFHSCCIAINLIYIFTLLVPHGPVSSIKNKTKITKQNNIVSEH